MVASLAGALKVGFESPQPVLHLPIVAELAAANDAVHVRTDGIGEQSRWPTSAQGGGVFGPTPAVSHVGTDVQACPIVNGLNIDGRLAIAPRRKIGSRCRAGACAECNRH